jgi:hypothetical protein
MYEANGRATAREPAVGVLVLAESGVGGGYAYVSSEMKFMPHIPGVTVNNNDKRLREPVRFCKRIDGPVFSRSRPTRCCNSLKRVDIDAP